MLARFADNPGMLKLMLALQGVAAERECDEPLELVLDGDTLARARINPHAALKLLQRNGGSFLYDGATEAAVRVVPSLDFIRRRNARQVALGAIVQLHGIHATVALGGGCGLSVPGRTCALCLGRELVEKAGELWPVDEVVEALRGAFDEGAAALVHFYLGYFPGDDAGLGNLRPYLDAVHHHFDTMVAVTMHPPVSPRAIDLTYASGVDALSYNLEAADEAAMRAHFPGRARFFGRQRYLEALRYAARVFPSGAVWSEILLDLSSDDAIRAAIDELAGMGVLPLLAVPACGPCRPLDLSALAPLLAHQFSSVLRAGLSMTWTRDLSTAIAPLDGRHLVPDAPHLPVLFQRLARNRFGLLTARALARLRRRLRVRRVRASFNSGFPFSK